MKADTNEGRMLREKERQRREKQKKRYLENPDVKERRNRRSKKWYEDNKEEILATNELDITFFNSPVIKFAVPSAVFNATFPVKPSDTITLTCPSIR